MSAQAEVKTYSTSQGTSRRTSAHRDFTKYDSRLSDWLKVYTGGGVLCRQYISLINSETCSETLSETCSETLSGLFPSIESLLS